MLVTPPTVANAAAATRMFDWNAQGGGKGTDHLNMSLKPSIEARGAYYPGIVTLQEVCRSQAVSVQSYMTSKGYGYFAMYHARFNASAETCATGYYGNVVWVWGAAVGSQWASDPYDVQVSYVYGAEMRGMACIGPTPYNVWACSTHLVPQNLLRADCQADEAFDLMENGYNLGRRGVLGGDFNTPSSLIGGSHNCNIYPHNHPPPTVLSWAYDQYHEADQYCCTDNQPTHSSGKIDYIFIKKGWGYYYRDLSVWTSPYSDHELLEAYLAW